MDHLPEGNNPLDMLEQTSSDLCKEGVIVCVRLVPMSVKGVINPSDAQWRLGRKVTPTGFPRQRALMLSQLDLRDEEPSHSAASRANNTASDGWYCTAKV